ncbi:MAG: hypothetical protein IKZ87_07205 [Actinomycetaceae bacterium]|nr:hypothetical protein [Actinomycetaceae bacterium]
MAKSPAHKFGQIIGNLLEEIMAPRLAEFCTQRGLYLDKKGVRGAARPGKKVTWVDKFGNAHDLDFVIEKGGTAQQRGRPLAFIETAWRRYTKHSRNKVQEIQSAILPIVEKYDRDCPFFGAVLAGEFTTASLEQLRSLGFRVAYIPYESVITSFASVGIDARFDESTPDALFQQLAEEIDSLSPVLREKFKANLVEGNSEILMDFIESLKNAVDRHIEKIIIIPLHGVETTFGSVAAAISFVNGYHDAAVGERQFRKFEIIVRYGNGDRIEAQFSTASAATGFLNQVAAS